MTLETPALPEQVADQIRQIASRHGVRNVRLFGSFARGEAGPGSDLDLIIRLDPGRGFRDLMDFCDELEAVVAKRVDAVTEDGLSPYLRERVLAEAVPL